MKSIQERIEDKLLVFPIILLAIHLLIRVFDLAKIMFSYPFSSEAVTQLAQLYFLDACGFHASCPYWYSGFTTFLVTPPAWYFFAYPFYLLSESVLIGSFTSLLATYVLAFLAIYWLGNLLGLTPIKRTLFFVLVFANNILIKNMSFGRFHEIFAWTMFIMTFLLLVRYKEKRIDEKAMLIPVFAALTITAHESIGILLMTVFAGFLLVKRGKEFKKAIGLLFLSLAASAFWLIPAFIEAKKNVLGNAKFVGAEAWWSFPLGTMHFTSVALILLPLITGIVFYSYYRITHKSIREVLFFLPPLGVIAFLFLGLMPFIPIMNVIFTNMYLQYTYIFLAFFIIKTYPYEYEYRFLYVLGITGMALAMVSVNFLGTPWFQEPTKLENNIVELGQSVNGRYMFMGTFPKTAFPPAYYGYFAIYNNLTTAGGWAPHIKDQEYLDEMTFFKRDAFTCEELGQRIEYFQLRYLFAYGENCVKIDQCQYTLERTKEEVCLYSVA